MPSPGYFALQHRVAPPRKAYSLTLSAFIAFGALYPFSLFKPVFRGSLIIFALYLNDVVMRYPESTYMQLVSDLQSIVDFEECQVLKLVNGCTVIALDETKSVKS